ncbi:uncharacterized protein G2W53_006037 [Senna tora]|uniref:Uncharacterized protein n=1 Tax=Senna tora TaxID=362788 RepID=A0A835CEE6_9FABA|nr:uncharacterized protein G2W53_006037 [Senna tora]
MAYAIIEIHFVVVVTIIAG